MTYSCVYIFNPLNKNILHCRLFLIKLTLHLSYPLELSIRPSLTPILIPPHCQHGIQGASPQDHTPNDVNSTTSEPMSVNSEHSDTTGQ